MVQKVEGLRSFVVENFSNKIVGTPIRLKNLLSGSYQRNE